MDPADHAQDLEQRESERLHRLELAQNPIPTSGQVLVIGGAGPIGSHVVDALLEEGCHVTVLDNLTRGAESNVDWRVRLIRGDIRDSALVNEAIHDCEVDTVFQLAAVPVRSVDENPHLAHEVMATGFMNVADACANYGAKLIVSSSCAVYGQARYFPTPETHPLEAQTLYGVTKAYQEGICRSLHHAHGLRYVALRYFNVYGPRMDTRGLYAEALVKWMDAIDNDEQPEVHNATELTTLDLIHMEDVARANVLAMKADEDNLVVNIGTGHEMDLWALACNLLDCMNAGDLQPKAVPPRNATAADTATRRKADTFFARKKLGFEAQIPVEEGLESLVAWWRSRR